MALVEEEQGVCPHEVLELAAREAPAPEVYPGEVGTFHWIDLNGWQEAGQVALEKIVVSLNIGDELVEPLVAERVCRRGRDVGEGIEPAALGNLVKPLAEALTKPLVGDVDGG